MKAWVLQGIGDIRLKTLKEPSLAEDEVLVQVKAAGICGSDIPRIFRDGTYSFPTIPGHEFSGIVVKSGGYTGTGWLGKRVGIFPLIPCGNCIPCKKKQYEMCRRYSYLGSRRDGGFAEYAVVPTNNLIELPENVSFEEAAMLEPMAVAVHAMRRIAPQQSDIIVICGAGTIGLLLLMFIKEAGLMDRPDNNVFIIGNKDFQRQNAMRLGLPEECYIDSRRNDVSARIMEFTNGAGADVFFECVGKKETLIHSIVNTAPGGRIMLVGNPASDMNLEKAVYWKILRDQITLMGTWNSAFTHNLQDDWHYVTDRLASEKIAPAALITHRFGLEELKTGLELMRDKTEDYVKVMARY